MTVMRLKGIKTARAKGKVYYYHRKTGERIHGEWGTAEFIANWNRLESKAKKAKERRGDTLDSLIGAYRASPEFTGLAPRTRADYEKVFDWIGKAKAMPVREMTPATVIAWRDKAHRQRGRRFANYLVSVLSLLCNWAKPRGFVGVNPASGVSKIRRPRQMPKANRAWTDEERTIMLSEATGGLRKGIALAMYAAISRSDVVSLPTSAYDGHKIVSTRGKNGVPIVLRVHPQLRAVLNEPPIGKKTLVINERSEPYTVEGFYTMFQRLKWRLEAEGRVGPGLTLHGLRHTLGKQLAEVGADSRTIAKAIGDRTSAMGEHYSAEANMDDAVDRAMRRAERRMNVGWKTGMENRKARKN